MDEDSKRVYLTKEEMDEINSLKRIADDTKRLSGFPRLKNEMYLKSKGFVGAGTDGYVFQRKGKTYKIYKTDYDKARDSNYDIDAEDDDDIKIVHDIKQNDKKSYNVKLGHFVYYDKNGVRLSDSDAFRRIALKRERVSMTDLPQKAIYYRTDSSKLIGIVGKYYHSSLGIHNAWSLPFNTRLKLVNSIIGKTEELYQNGIYHQDLAQLPDGYNKDTNVLLTGLTPRIIDIDGHSAVYTDTDNIDSPDIQKYKQKSLRNLVILSLDLLGRVDIEDLIRSENIDEIVESLTSFGVEEDYIEEILSDSPLTIDRLKEQVEMLSKENTKHKSL